MSHSTSKEPLPFFSFLVELGVNIKHHFFDLWLLPELGHVGPVLLPFCYRKLRARLRPEGVDHRHHQPVDGLVAVALELLPADALAR